MLVVDDDPLWRALLRRCLSAAGLYVETAASAFEASEKLRLGSYELILLDIVMPGMTGVELLSSAAVRARVQRPSIIAVSSVEDEQTQARCVELGASAFLLKPVGAARLLEEVERALEVDGVSRSGVRPRSDTCDNFSSCTLFPMFRRRAALRVYQTIYCYRKYEDCARYKLRASGTEPALTLLPDGGTLVVSEHSEDA